MPLFITMVITKFLMEIDAETDNRCNMPTDKDFKYLFYQCNDLLLSKNVATLSIKIVEDYVAIEEIQNRNFEYLTESLICRVENNTYKFQVKTIKEPSLLRKMEKQSQNDKAKLRLHISVYS